MSAAAASADSRLLAYLAERFELRIATLAGNVDESWPMNGKDVSLRLDRPGSAAARKDLALRCKDRDDAWPGLLDLLEPASRLSLLERGPLLARLCALALLARPGALRGCVVRHVREALAACLGPAYGRLREVDAAGLPLPAAAAEWSPLEWACVGYADLVHAKAWPHNSLRRLARLALPRRWTIGRSRLSHPLPQLSTMDALARLDALFEEAIKC